MIRDLNKSWFPSNDFKLILQGTAVLMMMTDVPSSGIYWGRAFAVE